MRRTPSARRVVRLAVLAVLAVLVTPAASVLSAGPAAATTTVQVTGPGTLLEFSGTNRDPVTQDRRWSFTPADATFTVRSYSGHTPVEIFVQPPISATSAWSLSLTAGLYQPLEAGFRYADAAFATPAIPWLGVDLAGDGRACEVVEASFTVTKAQYGADDSIRAFAATFSQTCRGGGRSTGRVVINNPSAPRAVPTPSTRVAVAARATPAPARSAASTPPVRSTLSTRSTLSARSRQSPQPVPRTTTTSTVTAAPTSPASFAAAAAAGSPTLPALPSADSAAVDPWRATLVWVGVALAALVAVLVGLVAAESSVAEKHHLLRRRNPGIRRMINPR